MNTNNRSSRRIQQTQESISQEFADVTRAIQREEKRRKKREKDRNGKGVLSKVIATKQ